MLRAALVVLVLFFLSITSVKGEETVPQYNLTGPEREIVVSWLFEVQGYLDVARNDVGVSARQALAANPSLDVTVWIRTNTKGVNIDQRDWDATGMVWWIWKHDGVNVTPPQRPPESALWIGILTEWRDSIDRAFIRVSDVARNANTVPITAEDGTVTTMPVGTQLLMQRSMFEKVRGVLQ